MSTTYSLTPTSRVPHLGMGRALISRPESVSTIACGARRVTIVPLACIARSSATCW